MSYTIDFEFTYEEALLIQEEQLLEYETILKPEVMAKLRELVLSTNTPNQNPFRVCRGTSISNILSNMSINLRNGKKLTDFGVNVEYQQLTILSDCG